MVDHCRITGIPKIIEILLDNLYANTPTLFQIQRYVYKNGKCRLNISELSSWLALYNLYGIRQ